MKRIPVEKDLEPKADAAPPLHFDRWGNRVAKPMPEPPAVTWAKSRSKKR